MIRRGVKDGFVVLGAGSIDDEVFDGDVILATDDDQIVARARLLGHLDPLDGHYHWAGTVFGPSVRSWKEARVTRVSVAVPGGEPAEARLTEITPSGDVRVVGAGVPPYPLESLVV
ncbi:DUF4873 domain-containing protein [Gordonia sp. NPDC003424]